VKRGFAVLEFTGSKKIDVEELKVLSDQARSGALKALPRDKYTVMTRENMATMLRQMGKKDCQHTHVLREAEVRLVHHRGAPW
jgi:hypothetical protein